MDPSYLDKLNGDQRRAVEHGIDAAAGADCGPLLVIAGAGSGKTNTLAHRVAHLVVHGADPARILLLTFTRRAAAEMIRRVERIVAAALGAKRAAPAAAFAWAGTFHGIGARLLREYAETIGLDPSFTIHDREDSADLMNLVRHELGLAQLERRFPAKATCLAIYSRTVNGEMPLDAVLAKAFPWCGGWESELRRLFDGYVQAKHRHNVLDYDDLLLFWAGMSVEPQLAADVAARFDHVLVDEYQDTNNLQARILLALKPDGRGLTVVGDDAQSIYSFRAATVRNILDFPNLFRPPAGVLTLAQNYRSTQPILAASNAVIALAAERYCKDLWSERKAGARPLLVSVEDEGAQARYVAARVLENREAGLALKAQAVLFRTSHHSAALELELTRRKIPFVKFGGLKFLESAHVKDVLACLRFIENPRDRVAGFRAIKLIPGLGGSAAGRILDTIDTAVPATALASLADVTVPARAAPEWRAFAALFHELSGREVEWPADFERVRLWYEPHLRRIHEEDADVRAADLAQLAAMATGYPSRERFLTELTLDPPDATSDLAGIPHLDEDYLILSTIHSAKGQEWKAVFLLNAVDGCIPSDLATGSTEEIEEERRILYVAMTRAKDQLDIVAPHRFYAHHQPGTGDRHMYATRTRFLPDALLHLLERRWWRGEAGMSAVGPARYAARHDIAARLRGRWR
ncbi:MAG TPA: ATP-dependent helicase [Xanthobacteraceae bacterium]